MADRLRLGLGLIAERAGPLACGVIVFGVLGYFQSDVVAKFATGGWKAEGLYSAVFNWAAIQTGFAFGVYGFVVGKSGGFIEAVRDTIAMDRFLRYVRTANIAGFLLTISSIPLLIVNPDLKAPSAWVFGAVALWFSLFVWAFLTFLRIAYTFGHLSSVRDAKPFHGAGA